MKSLLGVGVFNADSMSIYILCTMTCKLISYDKDELWKFHRSMTRPFFSKDRVSHFEIFDRQAFAVILILVYLTLSIHRHANDALQQMKARAKEGYAVDWQVCQVFPFGRLTIVLNVPPGSRFPLHTGLGNRIPFRKGRSVSVQWPSLSTDI